MELLLIFDSTRLMDAYLDCYDITQVKPDLVTILKTLIVIQKYEIDHVEDFKKAMIAYVKIQE